MSEVLSEKFFKKKRDWSKIKDDILGCYLVPYFTKILRTTKDIVYVDAFAGVGIFEDGSNGSPIIAYNASQNINKDGTNNNISFVLIEKSKKNYNKLANNVKNFNNTTIINDNYENTIIDILKKQINKNLFLYVDPFGIKNIKMKYFEEIKNCSLYSSEILLNLNSFGFIREGCRLLGAEYKIEDDKDDEFNLNLEMINDEKNTIDNMTEIAGNEKWKEIINDYKSDKYDGYEAEKRFVSLYCETLKEKTNYKYVVHLPIRIKNSNRPKYRIIFASNNSDAFLLMVNNMAKRFDDIRDMQNNGMQCLFDENVENEFIDDRQIENLILQNLSLDKYDDFVHLILSIISETGIYKTSKITAVLKRLENENKIEVKRIPEYTSTGKKATYFTLDKNKNIYLKLPS